MSQRQPPVAALFGSVAATYARHRPTYPSTFFGAFVQQLPARPSSRPVVWDCGCGSGQASVALADQGVQVLATDVNPEQLAAAPAHPLVHYAQAPADASGLAAASVDGVLVATAVHWFAGEAFNAEVQRVCRPGAVMAWIGYLPLVLELAPLQQIVHRFYIHTLAPWWPPQRVLVDRSYAGLVFPGEEWPFPQDLEIRRCWTLIDLLGYLGSWSAVAAAQAAGEDPLAELTAELAALWPGSGRTGVGVSWRFMGRWGQVQAGSQ